MVDSGAIDKYFAFAKELTLEAGKIIEKAIDGEKSVELKDGEWDVVTKYDTEVENFLIGGLSAKFPGHKFIGEETSAIKKQEFNLTNDPTWIIDPIDGTLNFVHAFPQTCISIALTIQKQLQIGIIYNPSNKEMYTAKKSQGAFLNDKKLQTSKVKELKKSLISMEPSTLHLSHSFRDITQGRMEALATEVQGIRCVGSAALTLAYVARGILDAFTCSGLKPWDVAAGVLIVQEAGGVVTDSKGGAYDVSKVNLVAAGNAEMATQITNLIVATDLKTQRKRLKKATN